MKVKCENCLSTEAIQPQIFVVATAPDASVKFEESTGTQTQPTTLGKRFMLTFNYLQKLCETIILLSTDLIF